MYAGIISELPSLELACQSLATCWANTLVNYIRESGDVIGFLFGYMTHNVLKGLALCTGGCKMLIVHPMF